MKNPARFLAACAAACLLALAHSAQAATPPCTIVARADTGGIIAQAGPCDGGISPASTFKVALALMGYDAGVLVGPNAPAWPYDEKYDYWNAAGKKATDPTSWQKESIVWYSQVLVQKLGTKRLQAYVDAFNYGNRDVSGTDRPPGFLPPASWISSSLQISPVEQLAFMRRLVNNALPASPKAHEMTRAIVPVFPAAAGWTVHGKTGAGFQRTAAGVPDQTRQFGWFAGWAVKGPQTLVFVRLLRDDAKMDSWASLRARDSLIADLPSLAAP